MEIPLYCRKLRRRNICVILPILPCLNRHSCFDNRVFNRSCQSKEVPLKHTRSLSREVQNWHLHSNFAIAGNYILLMFYTTVAGWMLYYFYKFAVGGFVGLDTANVKNTFNNLLASPATMTFWMLVVVVLGFGVAHWDFKRCRKNY